MFQLKPPKGSGNAIVTPKIISPWEIDALLLRAVHIIQAGTIASNVLMKY